MAMEEVARVYAEALFGAAKDKGKLDEIRDQLGQFTDAVAENRDLQLFFFSPYFGSAEKREALSRAVVGADPELVNFLELLIEKHRTPVLFRIRRQFDALWAKENKRLAVTVTARRLFSLAQRASNCRRILNSTGVRCFSISRSRKLTNSGSAPTTALARASRFSADPE